MKFFLQFVSFVLLMLPVGIAFGQSAPKISTPEEVGNFFSEQAMQGKKVITYSGYSALDYENKDAVIKQITNELKQLDPNKVIINSGGTEDGIGVVYKIAKSLGFKTSGIVSEEGAKYGMAADVDYPFYIQGKSWGGYVPGTKTLEPVSETIVKNSSEIRNIGGGAIAADEGEAASAMGKLVSFTPAESNHAKTIAKALKQGKPEPTNFLGDADARLSSLIKAKPPLSDFQKLAPAAQEKLIQDSVKLGSLSAEDAALIRGGSKTFQIIRVGGEIAGKALGIVGVAAIVYDVAKTGVNAYKNGAGLSGALGSAACRAVDDATFNIYCSGVKLVTNAPQVTKSALSVLSKSPDMKGSVLEQMSTSNQNQKDQRTRNALVDQCNFMKQSGAAGYKDADCSYYYTHDVNYGSSDDATTNKAR